MGLTGCSEPNWKVIDKYYNPERKEKAMDITFISFDPPVIAPSPARKTNIIPEQYVIILGKKQNIPGRVPFCHTKTRDFSVSKEKYNSIKVGDNYFFN